MSKKSDRVEIPMGDALVIKDLLSDLHSIEVTLRDLQEGWDEIRFGAGSAYSDGVCHHRNVGRLNLSQFALRGMLEFGLKDVKHALKKLGVRVS